MKIKRIEHYILILIMVISAVGMIYYGSLKQVYHVDEMYSYGLANSEYLPFMHFGESGYDVKDWMNEYGAGESFIDLFRNLWNDFKILKEYDFQFYNTPIYQDYLVAQANSADTKTTTWVSGQNYKEYLGVSESNTFNYASVYYNQRGDVHPPFYYMVLHTVCSIFQGTYSKWYALGINIVALLLTMLIIYQMLRKYIMNEKLALMAVVLYGISNGCFTTAMFIRMYALLTLFVTLSCYIHLKLFDEECCMHKKNVLKLMAVTVLGYMTHYYFVLYAIGISLVFCVWMGVNKKWKSMLQYVLSLVASAVIGLCVWPFAIKHVFLGNRGQESLAVFSEGVFHWSKLEVILQQVFLQLFGGYTWIPCVILGLLLLGVFLYRKNKKVLGKGALLVVPMLFYTVFVAQIVPICVERYVMCTYPLWCIIAVVGIAAVIHWVMSLEVVKSKFSQKKRKGISLGIVVALVGMICFGNNGFVTEPNYFNRYGQELYTVPEQSHCVYVLADDTWNESAEDTLMLSKCEEVAVTYYSNLQVLEDTYQYQDGDCVMVVISRKLNEIDVIAKVKEVLDIGYMQEAFREEAYSTVRIYLK